ncbi:(Na+)-NQR maturation NqrM [Sansalvadorimonas verongulae]|uniref:(Na+)-NQR maturation NqrM n=1 Tax=Sansalvadorimonas verongulae TaxID=2172824 RepID=UPI0012BB6145|nr:(Na+)-NQR maturation NqrM [Sansalvadorimonas verongulae]MTI14294.1 (Na+)-NQR maturation NqrM [Sansalvadorimonas verongulae]
MTVMILTFGLLMLIIAGMSVGVIFANKPIKGSCGGLGNLGLKESCPICGGGDDKDALAETPNDLFYDATAPQA